MAEKIADDYEYQDLRGWLYLANENLINAELQRRKPGEEPFHLPESVHVCYAIDGLLRTIEILRVELTRLEASTDKETP